MIRTRSRPAWVVNDNEASAGCVRSVLDTVRTEEDSGHVDELLADESSRWNVRPPSSS